MSDSKDAKTIISEALSQPSADPPNALTFDEEYPFATSPFCEEPRQFIARDQTVMHQTVGGKGVVGRIK